MNDVGAYVVEEVLRMRNKNEDSVVCLKIFLKPHASF